MINEQEGTQTPLPQTPPEKPLSGMGIVGYNLIAAFGYGVICIAIGESGIIIDIFLIVIHVIACIVAVPITRKWEWLLAGFLVACVGLATCVGGLSIS